MLLLTPAAVTAQTPNDYHAAVAAREAGQPAEARRLLLGWLEANPGDVDARLQLAYAELALGNLDEAQRGFEAVLRQAPEYTDARDGLSLAMARRTAPSPELRGGRLSLEGATSDLTGGASDWQELTFDAELPTGAGATVGGRASYYRRFGLQDLELVGRVGLHPSENVWLRAQIGATPNAHFRPQLSIGAGLDWRLSTGNATVMTVDGSYQRFPLQDVVTLNPGVVQYLGDGRGWITLRGIGTIADGGPVQVGGLVRGDFAPSDGWRLFAGAANGPDTDLGIVTRVTSLFGGVEVPLGDRFSLTGAVGGDWRKSGADRTEFRFGVTTRF